MTTPHPCHISFIATSEVLGGGEIFLLQLAQALSPEHPVIVVGHPESPLLTESRRLGVDTQAVDLGRKLGRRTAIPNLRQYRQAHDRFNQSLSQATTAGICVLQYKWEELLWGGRGHEDRVALIEHGPFHPWLTRLPFPRRRLRASMRAARAVYAVSSPASDSVHGLSGRTPTFLPAGTDQTRVERARTAAERIRVSYCSKSTDLLMVFAGRVVENKGVLDIVRTLQLLPTAKAVFVGQGPAEHELLRLADTLGVAQRIFMTGQVDDALPYLAAADVTILLTRDPGEGRPLTALESLAVGTPVVGHDGSPAMRALAQEPETCGLELVSATEPSLVAAGVRRAVELEASVATVAWSDTARIFLDGMRA